MSGLRRHVSTKKESATPVADLSRPKRAWRPTGIRSVIFVRERWCRVKVKRKKKGFGLLDEFCVISLLVLTAGLPSKATLMLWSTNLFFTQKETPTCIAQTGELNLSRGSSGYDRCHAGHVTDAASSGP